MTPYGLCELYLCETLRTTASLSSLRASSGRCSQTRMPGSAVGMVLNSPRMPSGASGFGSNVSMCDGPPKRSSRMTALAGARCGALAEALPAPARNASDPALSKSRRVMPWQMAEEWPRIRSIESASELRQVYHAPPQMSIGFILAVRSGVRTILGVQRTSGTARPTKPLCRSGCARHPFGRVERIVGTSGRFYCLGQRTRPGVVVRML